MFQVGSLWTLTGPDGTVVELLGVGAAATSTSPFVLEDVSGFDGPNVRQAIEDLPEFDGAIAGNFYYGSRPVTLRGRVIAGSAAERNVAVVQLQRTLRALRGDVTIMATADGLPPMQVTARLEQPPRITGSYIKDFLISLVCPDPRIYSQTLHNLSSAAGTGIVTGAAFPLAFDIIFGGGTGATATVAVNNEGNIDTPPVLRIYGPLSNPYVRNVTSGANLYLDNLTLVAGEYVDVNLIARTAVTSGGTNVYGRIRFPESEWWLLEPGVNDLELRAATSSSGSQLVVYWRDAWA